jgi:hypothetical protein
VAQTTHQQAAHFFLVINEAIGVAHHRQHGVHTFNLAADNVEMLGRIQRHIHTSQLAELPCPLAPQFISTSQRTSP